MNTANLQLEGLYLVVSMNEMLIAVASRGHSAVPEENGRADRNQRLQR